VWSRLAPGGEATLVVRMVDNTIVGADQAMCDAIGQPLEWVLGKTPFEVGLVDAAGLAERTEQLARDADRSSSVMVRHVGDRVIEGRVCRVTLGGEQCAVALIRDVTEHEQALSERDLVDSILEAAPAGFIFYDRDLRAVRMNAAAQATSRLETGMLVSDLADVSDAGIALLSGVLETGEAVVDQLMTGAGEQGDRSFRVTVFPVRSQAGGTVGVGCIYVDVTAHQRTESQLRESERRRAEILGAMLQAEEVERARIATALHDDTVQVMTASLITLDRLGLVARRLEEPSIESAVTMARATLEESTERTRRLMFELRPAILHESGLLAAVRVLAHQTARETGGEAVVAGNAGRYSPATEELVYRIVQEGLANVRKHAHAQHVRVEIDDRGGVLESEVVDDGRGFDLEHVLTRPGAALHAGLGTLTERVRAAGGEIDIDSRPGDGTRLRFTIPAG
jgi:signal transduction histidine kinase